MATVVEPTSSQSARPTAAPEGPQEPDAVSVTGRYRATRDGLIWRRPTKDGPVDLLLTNFTARIATDVTEDDGAEVPRRFEVEARLNGYRRSFTVAAESFAAMGWATEQLGARTIVFPGFGIRDHARAAVQILSGDIPERHVYSHTGWRELDNLGWAYLHGGGAISERGFVRSVEVVLPDSLAKLELPLPPDGNGLQEAVRASLRLVDTAPDSVVSRSLPRCTVRRSGQRISRCF